MYITVMYDENQRNNTCILFIFQKKHDHVFFIYIHLPIANVVYG